MIDMYSGGRLFKEKEWHDSYIFDQVRKKLEKKNNIKNFNICNLGLIDIEEGNNEHVFVTSVLGKYMDHKKGNRKDVKWSPELIKRVKRINLIQLNNGINWTDPKIIKTAPIKIFVVGLVNGNLSISNVFLLCLLPI